ncbi:hypothetical protein BX600DRAFT_463361 [Xylariales sp. PMI_506]|nr:hypothetical protein BX600DRAFT_463361 [Xylariales sp. PMI_506]
MSSQSSFSTFSMAGSPPPPVDLPTYAKSMHQHTKRQMEAASRSTHRRGNHQSHSQMPGLPNGISSTSSSQSPNGVEYHD